MLRWITWSRTIEEGTAYLTAIPEVQRIAMQYEDSLDDPDGELTRLADVVGVEPLTPWLRDARGYSTRADRAASLLGADDRAALVDSCAPGMQALNTLS